MNFRLLSTGLVFAALVGSAIAQQPGRQPTAPARQPNAGGQAPNAGAMSSKQKVSYGFGLDIGRTFKMQGVEVDAQALMRGLQDGITGANPLLTDEQLTQVMQEFQREMESKFAEQAKATGEQNQREAEQFLAQNRQQQGIVALPSGLQYKVLKEGTGQKPSRTDQVQAHYRGTLLDGTEFDSSYKRGEPATFAVDGVIDGWKEALQLMPVGSKWQLYVPPDLAYGQHSPTPIIGPNSLLVFEVELLGIQPPGEELPRR